MTRHSMLWRVVAGVFVLINVAGLVYALIVESDTSHALVHAGLLAAAIVVWKVVPWGRKPEPTRVAQLEEQRIEYLQQSVDAIALEVERIGEKQRFADKLRAASGEPPLKKDS